jgi:hypothetical protein
MAEWLRGADLIVPKRRHYLIETVGQHYAHAHHPSDLEAVRQAISSHSPAMLPAFGRAMSRRSLSLYNMVLGRREVLDDYAAWLFSILESAEADIPWATYDSRQRRVMGFLAERLLNVWLEGNQDRVRVGRRRTYQVEGEPRLRKAVAMVRRKVQTVPD